MALDNKFVQNIGLRVEGDQVFRSMDQLGKSIHKILKDLDGFALKAKRGGDQAENNFRNQIKMLQRMVGEANTLHNLLTATNSRGRNNLFSALDEANIGKKALSASMLKRELAATDKASAALEVRLGQLYNRFSKVAEAGRALGKTDINKALNTAEALKNVRKLEQQIQSLNARAATLGTASPELRGTQTNIASSYDKLLRNIQNGRRVNWSGEIASIQQMISGYNGMAKAELAAAAASEKHSAQMRRTLQDKAMLSQAQLRAQVSRASSGYQFSPAEVQRTDPRKLDAQITADMVRMQRLQAMMQRAGEGAGSSYSVQRLAAAWTQVQNQIAAATAQRRQFDRVNVEGTRQTTEAMKRINLDPAQIRAQTERGASAYRYTTQEARQLNMPVVNQRAEASMQRLIQLQNALSRAVAQDRSPALIDRLSQSWQRVSARMSEAIAQQRAFNNLPEQRMARMNEALFGGGNWKQFGARIAGASVLSAGVFAGLNAGQQSLGWIVQLEDALARLQAISGSTKPEIDRLGASIVKMGTDSRYSILEITEAATQIAQAGYSIDETAQVLQASLNLAAGSGSTVAEGVDTMTSSLGAFQLQAGSAGQVADALMQGLNESKLSIQQMQSALQYAGATAKESGMSLNELVAIAGSLANAGIRTGSTIGTGIRQLIVDLQTPNAKFLAELESIGLTMADVDVRANSLAQVVRNLTDAGFSAEAAYNSFEVRAASAFLAFRGQLDTYDSISLALTQSGAAAEAAAKANNSLFATYNDTKDSLGELVVLLSGPFMGALKATLELFNMVTQGVSIFVTALGTVVGAGTEVGQVITGTVFPALMGFAVGGPMGAAIGGLLGFIGAISNSSGELEKLQAATNASSQELDASTQTLSAVDIAMDRLIQRETELRNSKTGLTVEVLNLTGQFEGLASQLDSTSLSYDGLIGAMQRYKQVELQDRASKADTLIQDAVDQSRPVLANLRQDRKTLGHYGTNTMLGQQIARATGAEGQKALGMLGSYTARDPSYHNMGSDKLASEIVAARSLTNELRKLERIKPNQHLSGLVGTMVKHLENLEQMGSVRGTITNANRDKRAAEYLQTPEARAAESYSIRTRQQIQEGQSAEKARQGSGRANLDEVVRGIDAELAKIKADLVGVNPNSVEYAALKKFEADLLGFRSTAQRTPGADPDKVKDKPGQRVTVDQVAAKIKANVDRANITGTTRTAAQQAAFGTRKGDPAKAPHVTGNALDMSIIPGGDPMEIVALIESMGLKVTAAPVRGQDGIRYVTPNHGTAPHWHFEWEQKKTDFERSQAATAEEVARKLQQLKVSRAATRTGAANAKVNRVIAQGKAGNAPVEDLKVEMETALAELYDAALAQFDVENPSGGLDTTSLTILKEKRVAEIEKLTEAGAKLAADFFRAVSDAALDAYKRASDQAERVLKAAEDKSAQLVRRAEKRIRTAGNRRNKSDYDDGTAYLLNDEKEQAEKAQLKLDMISKQQQIDSEKAALEGYKTSVANTPEGPVRDEQLAQIEATEEKIRELEAALREIHDVYDETFGNFENEFTFGDKVKGAAQAWLENSGAMDSWGKMAINNIGPILDQMTSGFTDFFEAVFTGSKSFKAALGDMVRGFATFVVQMIARALALKVVNEILGALGLPTSAIGSYNGGPAGKRFDPTPPDYSIDNVAGITHSFDGGEVTKGVTNRDSALHKLAAGEYITRSKSVRELGLPFMETLNKHGKKGLEKVGLAGQNLMNIQAPRQETNVYVVSEKSRPTLSKNDVLVTIQEDMLTGGVTQKLVRQVAQGAI